MPPLYATLYPIVKSLVKDDANKLADPDDYLAAIEAILTGRYSADRPLIKVKDYAGNGVAYTFTLPATYIDGFSSIESVEYPAGERPQSFLDAREFLVDWISETAKALILSETTPATGQTLRVRYSAQRTIESEILLTDRDAVSKLAAALCYRMLAARYAQTSDPTISADVVNYRTKAQEYTALADKLEKDYHSQVSGDASGEGGPAASSGWVNWDTRQQVGLDYLFHPRRLR